MTRIFTISVAMGLLVSPEALTLVGNSAGQAGQGFVGFVLLAGLAYLLISLAYTKTFALYPGPSGEARFIRRAFGAIAAVVSPVCPRVTMAVCASTALLATAGYVFNEVFFYWFPNLGFSFCLLGFLLLLNLLGKNVAAIGQLFFVGSAVGGLLLLSLVGFLDWGNPPPAMPDAPTPLAHMPQAGVACLLLFVGFDLAGFAEKTEHSPAKAMTAAILVAGLVFCCWGSVSLKFVPSSKVVDTSIPYVKVARAMLGQWGRIWMGLIILSGACAAVNALLVAVSRMMTAMASDGLLPPFLAKGKGNATIALLFLAAAVAAMMALGMAGEPILETYIKAGTWFWLLHYAVIQAALIVTVDRVRPGARIQKKAWSRLLTGAGLAAMVLAATAMLLLEEDWGLLLRILLLLLGTALFFAAFWIFLGKKKGWLTPS
ncbi:MAG: amino acid permease [Thermodesulfobacteriota bacterium]|nr:amino acid permease [Thermodesulfobacteriota bacterium]